VHTGALQTVPAGTVPQLPEPLQLFWWQSVRLHSFFGSVPAVAFTHEVPVASTTWHVGHEGTAAQRIPVCA
jgi:hypothetical protein